MPKTVTNTIEDINVIRDIKSASGGTVIIRKGAGNTSQTIGFLNGTEVVQATKLRNGYYYINSKNGWVAESHVTVTRDYSELTVKTVTKEMQEIAKKRAEELKQKEIQRIASEQQKEIYMQYVNSEYGGIQDNGEAADTLLVNNLNGIYGIPYQFPESVDSKLPGSTFGSIYADRIITRMPLLMMSPGKVDFMSSYSDGEKKSVVDALAGVENGDATMLNSFLSKPGKYYTFKYDSKSYWEYVNAMNHACAVYLGIDDVEVNINGVSGKLSTFHWEKASNSKFDSLLVSSQDYVCFYTDADSSKTESFSNSTTESMLASKVNDFSDIAKEIQFLVGSQTGKQLEWLKEENINNLDGIINDAADKWLGGSQLFKDVGKEFAVIATGGKLIFPQIWSDSEFTQSFDVKIKLRCPCPNKVSWYLDICVPLNHLIAFTLPRTPKGDNLIGKNFSEEPSANGYMTPFLVRAFYKGLFNCDMGIVTDLNISKGKEGSWTLDGLPSEVDVDMTIKDLYNVMCMTTEAQTTEFLNNSTFLNYMANSCGISINKPDLERSLDIWMMIKTNVWKNRLTGYNFWQSARQGTMNKLYSLYSGFFKG